MSNFSLRPSTIKKSEATKERLKLREETKKIIESRKFLVVFDQEKRELTVKGHWN